MLHPRQVLFLAGAVILLPVFSAAQTTPLAFRPIAAEYSNALDRIIMISASPNQLHIYNPISTTDQIVALSKSPLSLSVSSNGLYAAVGHDSLISYVNLSSAAVQKTFTITSQVKALALGSTHIYILQGNLAAVSIANGSLTPSNEYPHPDSSPLRLDSAGQVLYVVYYYNFAASPVSGPTIGALRNISSSACSSVYGSEDGALIYDGCGTVYTAATATADAAYRTSIQKPASDYLSAIDESGAARRVAFVEPNDSSTTSESVVLVDSQSYRKVARFALPDFKVGANSFKGFGKWVFFNSSGSLLYVLQQAPSSAGLLLDFAITRIEPAPPSTSCTVTVDKSALTIPGSGSTEILEVSSAADCVYKAATTSGWIQIGYTATGSGKNKISVLFRRNSGVSRSGTITIGNQTVNVTQAAPDLLSTVVRLAYPIVKSDYSRSLDRMILLSADPDELHILDPVANTEQVVGLPFAPQSLSLSPDGYYAAVGFDGSVSYMNLKDAKLENTWPTNTRNGAPVTPGNGYLYWTGSFNYGTRLRSLQMSTGQYTVFGDTDTSVVFAHPGGQYLYTIRSRIDVIVTPPSSQQLSTSALGCSPVWFSETGNRLYNTCGNVYRVTEGPDDMQPNGSFSVGSGIHWASNSAIRQSTAIAPRSGSSSAPFEETEVQLYADNGILLTQRFPLPWSAVDGVSYASFGRAIFWNGAADRLHSLVQIDSKAQLISDDGYLTITPGTSPTCTVTLSPASASFTAAGGSGEFSVQTGQNCYWSISSAYYASANPQSGSGPRTVSYTISSNSEATPRTFVLTVSGQTFTINQAGFTAPYVSASNTVAAAQGGNTTLLVTAPSGYAWTAVSNTSWIVITQGTSGVGNGLVSFAVAANPGLPRSGTLTIAGQTVTVNQNGATTPGFTFKPITPCRLMETRPEYNFEGRTGSFGPPFLAAGETRTMNVRQSTICSIPATAKALFLNVTLAPKGPVDYVTVWPAGASRPGTWNVRSTEGFNVANSAIVQLGANSSISVYSSNDTDMVIDISGYFTDDRTVSNLAYYPMNPCRVLETRVLYRPEPGPFGGPSLAAQTPRRIPFPQSPHCSIPSNAAAYSVTLTAVPSGPLAYITAWPGGAPQPNISSLNSPQNRVLANSMILPAGIQGSVDVLAYNNTDLIMDINGYFAPDDGVNGLFYYPITQCRAVNTTSSTFASGFGPPLLGDESARSFPMRQSACAASIPATVKAYALTMTALPNGLPMPFLTAWPTGQGRPNASQLNAFEGQIVTNSAIVPSGTNSAIDVFAYRQTHLVIELSGYFGR